MSYSTADGRHRLLGDLAQATTELSVAVDALGEAYELLDERLADRLEQELFRPVQLAYGRVTRNASEFAARHGLSAPSTQPGSAGSHQTDPRVYVQRAGEAVERADHVLSELQDSMLPVEVGDRELREGLSGVRELIAPVPGRARELLRTVGR